MQNVILVAVGGAIGASIRHGVNIASVRLVGMNFPWGTLAINIVGCLAMGLLVGTLARIADAPNALRLFLATGVLGGFTTFSAFSLDFATLWERGALAPAFGYLAGSVGGSLIAVFAGLWIARSFG